MCFAIIVCASKDLAFQFYLLIPFRICLNNKFLFIVSQSNSSITEYLTKILHFRLTDLWKVCHCISYKNIFWVNHKYNSDKIWICFHFGSITVTAGFVLERKKCNTSNQIYCFISFLTTSNNDSIPMIFHLCNLCSEDGNYAEMCFIYERFSKLC